MPTFDLLVEPWIPVVRSDGSLDEMGLRQVLADAPSLREIRDPIPTIEFGLYRLLVALVMDICELRETPDLEDLLAAGHFDGQRVNAYFERWGDRFDLFHPEHPCMQTAGMENEDEKPFAALLPAVPSGTSALHFHHHTEESFAVSPAAAARLLATMPPFMTSGGRTLSPSINGAPPWYVLIQGASVFCTVCLNCCVSPLPQATGDAPPAWRNGRTIDDTQRRTGASLLEALTWRPRRIQLIPNGAGRCSLTGAQTPLIVRTMRFCAGDSCDVDWRDPNVAYHMRADQVRPLRPREARDLWRDSGALALLQERDRIGDGDRAQERFERPAIITQFAGLVADGVIDVGATLNLVAYGMRTDMNKKVFEWQRESLSLPTPLVWRSPFRAHAQLAIDQAERAAACLKYAVRRGYPRDAKGNKAAFGARIAEAQRGYWQALRPDFYRLLEQLVDLPDRGGDEQIVSHMTAWQERITQAAWVALDRAIGDLDTDADALARQVAARVGFRIAMAGLFTPPSERRARKQRTAASGGAIAADSDMKGGA
jgi:CRISPR system Cascade subunit CasA